MPYKIKECQSQPWDWKVSRIKIYIYFDSSELWTISKVMEGFSRILKALYLLI